MTLHRAQILLEPEIYRRLKEMARHERRSISDITREVINRGLALREDTEEIWGKRMEALEHMHQIREEIKQKYGTVNFGLVSEMWDEHEQERERIWGDER